MSLKSESRPARHQLLKTGRGENERTGVRGMRLTDTA